MIPQQPTSALGYILKGYPRISETFISNEILLLEKMGFTMRLFPMRKPRENFSHASVKEIRARVDYLPTELVPDFFNLLRPNIFLSAKKPKQFKETLRTAAEGTGTGSCLATLKHLLQAGYLANNHLKKENNIVQLHGHFAHSPTSVTLFASLLSGIPFSFTAHAKDIYTSEKEKLRKKISRAEFVVTCTKHNQQYLQKIAGSSTPPIYCIYHGIDLDLFRQIDVQTEAHNPYKILTVARMTQKKGLPTIYRALARLRQKGIQFQHTLIGDGDDREKILGLISSLGLVDHCRWIGTQTHDEVLLHFKASDLFVLGCEIAENGDRDGIPNVLVESLAMGVPALSTSVSAIPEIIIDEKTGLIVPPSDPECLEKAMIRMLTDQQLRKRVISGGQQYVKESFDNGHWTLKLAEIFRLHNERLQCI
ncbi:MAG: glycosyltransferase family 4 protein [Desulforhopalus sp.]